MHHSPIQPVPTLTKPLRKKFFLTSNLNFPQHSLPSCHLLCLGCKYHTANARGLQATGGWKCSSVNCVPLLFPTLWNSSSLGPKLWGKKIKRIQEECKQLLQSQQRVLAPKPMDLFSFEELDRKEDNQCFRKSALPQLDLWSIADPKQAPAIQGCCTLHRSLACRFICHFWIFPVMLLPLKQKHTCRCSA